MRHSRFGTVAAVAAVSVLSGATSGCATYKVLTDPEAAAAFAPRKPAPAEAPTPAPHHDLAARAAALVAELDRLPSFDPERRAAEPVLVALAAKIAAGLGDPIESADLDAFDVPAVEYVQIADLSAPPAALVAAPPENPWAVEFGEFDDAELAKAMWLEIAAAAPDAARGLSPRVVARGEGVILRAGPLDDRDQAAVACQGFETAGVSCAPAKLAGKPLMEPGG
ncbi:MAG: SPOR domain-containing protein [Alphaproteobacteria bacterium]|nr:SPOR domain-containing protein [Alphaproteobacteria bacterium]